MIKSRVELGPSGVDQGGEILAESRRVRNAEKLENKVESREKGHGTIFSRRLCHTGGKQIG